MLGVVGGRVAAALDERGGWRLTRGAGGGAPERLRGERARSAAASVGAARRRGGVPRQRALQPREHSLLTRVHQIDRPDTHSRVLIQLVFKDIVLTCKYIFYLCIIQVQWRCGVAYD